MDILPAIVEEWRRKAKKIGRRKIYDLQERRRRKMKIIWRRKNDSDVNDNPPSEYGTCCLLNIKK